MKSRKKVLIIANQFPPMGGSGVQRTVKFVKFLRNFGYEPVVVCKYPSFEQVDESLLSDIPENTEIIRLDAKKSGPISKLYQKIITKSLIPDSEILWAKKIYKIALKRLRKNDIDLIYSTSFPYSDHLIALDLKKEYKDIPWLVDFRDEWCNNPYIIDMNYSEKRMQKERKMEREVLENCDFLITNTKGMLDGFLKDYSFLKNISAVIPNGFDDDDFIAGGNEISKDKFILTYAGSMYGRRKPDRVLKAISELISESKIDRGKIKLEFIGRFMEKSLRETIRRYNLSDVCELISYMPHTKLLQRLSKSSALLLIIGEGKGAENFSSGKIFEYINLSRRVLAVVPKHGAAADIINEVSSGIVANTGSDEEIKKATLEVYKLWENGDYYPDINKEILEKYKRVNQTKTLAKYFDSLLEKKGKLNDK